MHYYQSITCFIESWKKKQIWKQSFEASVQLASVGIELSVESHTPKRCTLLNFIILFAIIQWANISQFKRSLCGDYHDYIEFMIIKPHLHSIVKNLANVLWNLFASCFAFKIQVAYESVLEVFFIITFFFFANSLVHTVCKRLNI